MRNKLDQLDVEVAAVAARQHGVVTQRQLREAGMGRAAISRRTASGRLHRLHQGVYAIGYPVASREGRWMAAVLASGDGAVLSHMSAAALWELLRPIEGPVDVSPRGRGGGAAAADGRTGRRLDQCQERAGAAGRDPPSPLHDLDERVEDRAP